MIDAETVFIPVADGLNTSKDPRAGAAVMAAENVVFSRRGVLAKRTGQTRSDPYTSANPSRVATQGGSAVLWGNGPVTVQTPGAVARTITADQHLTLDVEVQPIWTVSRPDDCVACPTFTAVTAIGSELRTFDPVSGALIQKLTLRSGGTLGIAAKLVKIGSTAICYYFEPEGSGLALRSISAGGSIGAEALISNSLPKFTGDTAWFDACVVENGGSPYVVLFFKSSGDEMVAIFLPDGLTAGQVRTVVATGDAYKSVCTCYARDATRVDFVWIQGTGPFDLSAESRVVSTQAVSINTGTLHSYAASTYHDDTARSLAGIGKHRTAPETRATVYATFDTGSLDDHAPEVKEIEAIDSTGTMEGAVKDSVRRCALVTKPVALSTGWLIGVLSRAWLFSAEAVASDEAAAAADPITAQDTFVWLASGAQSLIPVGKSSPGRAYWPGDRHLVTWTTGLPQWTTAPGGELVTAHAVQLSGIVDRYDQVRPLYLGVKGNVRTVRVANLYKVKIGATDKLAVGHDEACLLPGSLPLIVDGENLFEQGFLAYPEPISVSAETAEAGVDVGEHYYAATYEELDARGVLHRSSAASTSYLIDVPADKRKVRVKVPVSDLTLRKNVQVVLWRTLAGDTETLLRVAAKPMSSVTHVVEFEDTTTDTEIDQNEPMHMVGGVLGPLPPPSYAALAFWDRRMFVVDAEDPKRKIDYSRRKSDHIAYEHNPDLSVMVDERGGKIVALAPLGESLIVFKEAAIFALDGTGLNSIGQGDNYAVRPIPGLVGCKSPLTIAETPLGLIFDSGAGLYLLGEDMALSPIETPQQVYEAAPLVCAVDQPLKRRSIFLSSGVALVFDWPNQRFTTWTNHAAIDAVDLGGVLYRLTSDKRLWTAHTAYADDGAFISARVRLGWIYPGELGGRGLVKEIMPVMYKRGHHQLTIRVGYNGSPYFVDQNTYSAANLQAFDAATHYGAGSQNLAEQAYTLRYQQSRRNVSSLMLELQDSADGQNGNTAGFEILGVGLTLAKLPGPDQVDRPRHVRG